MSFVSSAADLEPVTERLQSLGLRHPGDRQDREAAGGRAREEIVAAATGGVMVARGDLGIELPLEQVPVVQKRLIAHGRQRIEAGRSRRPRCWRRWSRAPARPGPR